MELININTVSIGVVTLVVAVLLLRGSMKWCRKVGYIRFLNTAVQISGKNTESRGEHSKSTVRGTVTYLDDDSLHINIEREEDVLYTTSDHSKSSFVRDGADFKYSNITHMKKIVPPSPATLYGDIVKGAQ